MIFQYKGFNFKIDLEDKSIFSLIIENKKLYRKIIEDLINNISIDDGNIILSKNNKLIVPEKEIFVFSDYFNFDVNKFVLNKYYKKLEEDLDISQILKAFGVKFQRNEDLLLNLFEWIKILNELLGYEIFFFINLENFLSNDELVEFSKFILYNKYRVVFLENFNRNRLFDDDNLIIIDNDLCEIF